MKNKDAHLEEAIIATPETCIIEIAKRLRDKRLRHAHIATDQGPVGVVSVSDINAKVVAEGKDPHSITAEEVMSVPLHTTGSDEDVRASYYKMLEYGIFSLPVIEEYRIIGVLTMNEALKEMVREQHERRKTA